MIRLYQGNLNWHVMAIFTFCSDLVFAGSGHFLSIPLIYRERQTESFEHWAAEESHLSSLPGR